MLYVNTKHYATVKDAVSGETSAVTPNPDVLESDEETSELKELLALALTNGSFL